MGDRPGRGGGLRGGAASAQPPPAAAVPHFRYEELERRIGAKFDTVLVDCEGCIETALGGANAGLLSQIELLLIEEDVPQQTDYAAWHARLRAAGLQRVWRVRDTFAPDEAWSRQIVHSVWRRGGLRGMPTCQAFAAARGLPAAALDCLHRRAWSLRFGPAVLSSRRESRSQL